MVTQITGTSDHKTKKKNCQEITAVYKNEYDDHTSRITPRVLKKKKKKVYRAKFVRRCAHSSTHI